MILTFYKNYKYKKDGENQPVFSTVLARDTYLSTLQVAQITNDGQFCPNLTFVDVDSDIMTTIHFCNYLKIKETDDTNIEEYFYYITDGELVAPAVYRLYLNFDEWGTYFNYKKSGANDIVHPLINHIKINTTTKTGLLNTPYNLLTDVKDDLSRFPLSISLLPQTVQWVGCCIGKTSKGIIGFYGTDGGSWSKKWALLNAYSLSGIIKIKITYNSGEPDFESDFEPIACYVIPDTIFPFNQHISESDPLYTQIYFKQVPSGQGWVGACYPIDTTTKTYTIFNDYVMSPSFTIGTFYNRIKFEYNSNNKLKIDLVCIATEHSLKLCLHFGEKYEDITNDFSIRSTYNPNTQFLQQEKTNRILTGLTSAITLAGGIATGNPLAIAGSVVGAGKSINDFANIKTGTVKIKGEGYADENIYFYNGLFSNASTYTNKNEIDESIINYGWAVSYSSSNNPIVFDNIQTNSFEFVKCDSIDLTGDFPENSRTEIEKHFLNGVRLWKH